MTTPTALTLVLSLCALTTTACRSTRAAEGDARLARGKYLVAITGCSDCHTPMKMGPRGPEPDLARAFSGHPGELLITKAPAAPNAPWAWLGAGTNTAFAGPWGVSFSPNLTPDDTGLGPWTEEIFIKAMRTGRHWGTSRPILPPMPWPALAQASDADLRAIFAFLRSLPPVKNTVPEPLPPATAKR